MLNTRGLLPGLAKIAAAVLAERDRWTLWLPVAFAGGISLYFSLPLEPPLWAGGLCVLSLLGAFLLLGRTPAGPLLLLLLLFAGGFLAAELRTALVSGPVLPRDGTTRMVEARLLSIEPQGKRQRLLLDRVSISGLAETEMPLRIRVTLGRADSELRPGDRLRFKARLSPPSPPEVPGGYDFARAAFFQRLGAVGFVLGEVERLGTAEGAGLPSAWLLLWSDLRQKITGRVLEALPREEGALVAAITTGERGALPDGLVQAMRDSGLAHLLAISGLHIGLVAATLFYVLRLLLAAIPAIALNWPIKKWAAAVAALGAFVYLFLAGATVPTQRAFLSILLVLLAVLLDRRALGMRLVAWAAFVILLLAPESLLTPSFQLSFAAVAALAAGYEALRSRRMQGRGTRWPQPFGYFGALALSSLLATLATVPFAVHHFNRLALYGIAANLLAVPLFGIWIMPLTVLLLLAMPLGLESLALWPLSWGLSLLAAVARWVAAWPGAVIPAPAMSSFWLGIATLGGLWLVIWRGRQRWYGLPFLVGACLLPLAGKPPDLLVSARAGLLAVRDLSGNLMFSSLDRGDFTAEQWLRRNASAVRRPWPAAERPADSGLSCNGRGCVLEREGFVVALPSGKGSLAKDCSRADLIIRPTAFGGCPRGQSGPLVLDRRRLLRDGAHAVWLEEGRLRIENVAQQRGHRPWSRPPRARKRKPQ